MYMPPRFRGTGTMLVLAIICSSAGVALTYWGGLQRAAGELDRWGRGEDSGAVLFVFGIILAGAGIVLLCICASRIGRVVDAHSGATLIPPATPYYGG